MLQKVGRKTFDVYGYDVESDNSEESIKKNETFVWLASFLNENSTIDDPSSFYYDIPSWLDKLEELSTLKWHEHKRSQCNVMVFIYNLSFEWSFILPCLLKRGFKYKEKFEKDDSYVFNSVTNKTCASVWTAELRFKRTGGQVIFRDLCKIFPGGLGAMAKSFGLKTLKGDLDYTKNHWHDKSVTAEDKIYSFGDTRIIVEVLLKMKDDKDFWKSCSAATYACRNMIREGFPHAWKPMKAFRKFYPLLDEVETAFLRKGVSGGITYAPNLWQFVTIKQTIGHLDIHQAHPNSAYRHLFPWGKGTYFKGLPPIDHFYICMYHVKVSYSGVRLHCIIKLIGIDIGSDIELWLWDFELENMKRCYIDLEYEIIDGYAYRGRMLPWREFYKGNFDKRQIAKAKGDGFNVARYKLLNNSSYGKLLEAGHASTFENYIREDGVIDSIEIAKDHPSINATYTYLPVGSAIPAWTRTYLTQSALTLSPDGTKIVYFDTDSIFYIKDEETIANSKKLHIGDQLGDFGIEKDIKQAQFTAPKRYKIQEIQEDGSTADVFHMAGINFARYKDLPTFDDLDIVSGHYTIQGIKRVKGGTIIVFKEKDIGIQPKYRDIAKRNLKRNN